MKKIVRQQNYLRELIESQENRFLSKHALRAISRAVLEPLLDNPEPGVVLHRIINKEGLIGLIKRLEFSEVEAYDFSDESENLKEKVWANTEFLCVLTRRFVVIFLWDSNTDSDNTVRYYSIFNSKLQNEALDIIDRNTNVNIKDFQEKFKPDRRDNNLLNSSLRRLIDNLDEASKDAVLGFAEVQTTTPESNNKQNNIRAIAHEIKNQFSICDLYAEIIRKYCQKNNIEDKTLLNAADCITRAVKIGSNSLIDLKSKDNQVIEPHKLKDLINEACDLTKVYFECKNIDYIVENNSGCTILADKDKFISVIINLVKNAVEAFGIEEENVRNGKYIKIETKEEDGFAIVSISNNAGKIDSPEEIFNEGYTTKTSGSGLGLFISKIETEKQFGQLNLEHTGDDYTEFVIKMGVV